MKPPFDFGVFHPAKMIPKSYVEVSFYSIGVISELQECSLSSDHFNILVGVIKMLTHRFTCCNRAVHLNGQIDFLML